MNPAILHLIKATLRRFSHSYVSYVSLRYSYTIILLYHLNDTEYPNKVVNNNRYYHNLLFWHATVTILNQH